MQRLPVGCTGFSNLLMQVQAFDPERTSDVLRFHPETQDAIHRHHSRAPRRLPLTFLSEGREQLGSRAVLPLQESDQSKGWNLDRI